MDKFTDKWPFSKMLRRNAPYMAKRPFFIGVKLPITPTQLQPFTQIYIEDERLAFHSFCHVHVGQHRMNNGHQKRTSKCQNQCPEKGGLKAENPDSPKSFGK